MELQLKTLGAILALTAIFSCGTITSKTALPKSNKPALATPSTPSPESPTWVKTGGPPGGLGYDIRIHPTSHNIMFVTDAWSGANMSIDGGKTWFASNEGIIARSGPSGDAIPVFSLTIDPNDPNIIWAGTQGVKGIYKSTDGGRTWVKKDKGVVEEKEISFRGFTIMPGNSDIVFAQAEIGSIAWAGREIPGRSFDKTKGKVYKTTDGGENWTAIWEGENLARYLWINPQNPDVLYVSTGIFDREAANSDVQTGEPGGVGILKSTDGGRTWRVLNQENGLTNLYIGSLFMHPENPDILLAAAGNHAWSFPDEGDSGGVFITTDGGETWKKVIQGEVMTAVEFCLSDPNIAYAASEFAVYRSEDGGYTWKRFSKPGNVWGPPGIWAGIPIDIVCDPEDPMHLFINNYSGGNFESRDGGETWSDASKGYTGAMVRNVVVDPRYPARVYAGSRTGPFMSPNGGEDWFGLSFAPATTPGSQTIALNSSDPDVLLLASATEGGKILKSTDGGRSWRVVFKHPEIEEGSLGGFRVLSFAPSDPKFAYGGMSGPDGDTRPIFGVYRSKDGGETWEEANDEHTADEHILALAVDPTDPKTVYVGTSDDGVFKTTDGGETWEAKNNGLAGANVRSLAIDPHNPEVVYVGLGHGAGMFKSTDGGENWEAINKGINLVCPPELLPIGRVREGVSLEPPRAVPVRATDLYDIPWTVVTSIVIDPLDSRNVYASDLNGGVYFSADGGASWYPINEGLTTRAVNALAISSEGSVLYAATEGGGVFRLGDVKLQTIYLPMILKCLFLIAILFLFFPRLQTIYLPMILKCHL
jgi:photosystem II stability/assembly factor-like uncharacterized protein